MWIIMGLAFGIVLAVIIDGILMLISLSCDCFDNDKILAIPAIIAIAIGIIWGVQTQKTDKWVDFYDDNGQIVETYEIDFFSPKIYGDGVTFNLKDGRTIVKKECSYHVRFGEDN